MKVRENRTTFHCDFCSKYVFSKGAMTTHEKNCNSNPANDKACYGCDFLEKTTLEVYFDSGRYEEDGDLKEVEVFRCSKLDKYIYPFSIERKKLPERYPQTYQDQEPMPKKCEYFKELYSDII